MGLENFKKLQKITSQHDGGSKSKKVASDVSTQIIVGGDTLPGTTSNQSPGTDFGSTLSSEICNYHFDCPSNHFCHSGLRSDGTWGSRHCVPYVGSFCNSIAAGDSGDGYAAQNGLACGPGDGDCDTHDHCYGDFYCGVNNCAEEFYYRIRGYEQNVHDIDGDKIVRAADCCTPLPPCGAASPYPANTQIGPEYSNAWPDDRNPDVEDGRNKLGDWEYSGAEGGPCFGDGRWNTAWSTEYHDSWEASYSSGNPADGFDLTGGWNIFGWRPKYLNINIGNNKKDILETTGYTASQVGGDDGGESYNSMYAWTYFVPYKTGDYRFFTDCDDGCTLKLGVYDGNGSMDVTSNWDYYYMHKRYADDETGQSSGQRHWAPHTNEDITTWSAGDPGRNSSGGHPAGGDNDGWKWTGQHNERYSELFELEKGMIYRLQVRYWEHKVKSHIGIFVRGPDDTPSSTDTPSGATNEYAVHGGTWKYGCCDNNAINFDRFCGQANMSNYWDNNVYLTDCEHAEPCDEWGVGVCICRSEACYYGTYEGCCGEQYPNYDPYCEDTYNCVCNESLCSWADPGTGGRQQKGGLIKKIKRKKFRGGGQTETINRNYASGNTPKELAQSVVRTGRAGMKQALKLAEELQRNQRGNGMSKAVKSWWNCNQCGFDKIGMCAINGCWSVENGMLTVTWKD